MDSQRQKSEHLTIAAFISSLPGERHLNVQNPPRSVGWRLRQAFRRHLDLEPSDSVRGFGVAVDSLLCALLNCRDAARFALFIDPGQPVGETARQLLRSRGVDDSAVDIHSRTAILTGALQRVPPDAWLDLDGTAIGAFSVRNHFANRVYPVLTLQHAFSPHHLLYDRFLRLILSRAQICDSIVCTSRAGRKGMEKLLCCLSAKLAAEHGLKARFEGRVDTIPLCVDTEVYRPGDKEAARRQLKLAPDALVLLYVGYIAPIKADLLPLLAVFQRLASENPDQKLVFLLLGGGWKHYQQLLVRRAREIKIEHRLAIMTDVTDATKRAALNAADIFVSPSDTPQEAFGITPVEAMACGVPQVVSDWNGYRDTVRHCQTGFLIPTYWTSCDEELRGTGDLLGWRYDHMVLSQSLAVDVRRLFEALQGLIHNQNLRLRMAERSREIAVSEFSYTAVARQYCELWRELSAQAASLRPFTPRCFDQPEYSRVLGHYATRALMDDCLLVIRTSGVVPQELLRAANGWGGPVVDEALVNSLMGYVVEQAKRGQSSVLLGTLVTTVAEQGFAPNIVRRHVLWMVKYGFLEPYAEVSLSPMEYPWER